MKNRITLCSKCSYVIPNEQQFCPKCGTPKGFKENLFMKVADNPAESHREESQLFRQNTIDEMAKNISTMKKIMVFFTWLWAIGVLIAIIAIIGLA